MIFTLMLILSCTNNTSLDFNIKYLFTYIQLNNIRTITKFNTDTGSLSIIRTDPLCSHTNLSDFKFNCMRVILIKTLTSRGLT